MRASSRPPVPPANAKAAQEFAHALLLKDLWYLQIDLLPQAMIQPYLSIGIQTPYPNYLDHGISDFSRGFFNDWTGMIVRKAGKQAMGANFSAGAGQTLGQAIDSSMPTYEQYRLARDWAEFAAAGRSITNDPDGLVTRMLAMNRPWAHRGTSPEPDFVHQAESFSHQVAQVLGPAAITAAGKRLLTAPKDRSGYLSPALVVNGREYTDPPEALMPLLGEATPRNYLIMIAARHNPYDLSAGVTLYNRWVAAYGEKAVADAAERVRRAPKKPDSFDNLVDAAAIGGNRGEPTPLSVFRDILEGNHDARARVRVMLAFHDKLDSTAAVDAAYSKFAAAYDQARTAKALADMDSIWSLPPDLVSEEYRDLARQRYMGWGDPGDFYPVLIGFLAGTRKVLTARDGAVIEHPLYAAWKNYPIGSTVTFASRNNAEASITLITRTLSKKDGESVTVYGASRRFTDRGPFDFDAGPVSYSARILKELAIDRSTPQNFESEDKGSETIEIGGRKYDTRWRRLKYQYLSRVLTVWYSDSVPGGEVRRLDQQTEYGRTLTTETVLQPFQVPDLKAQSQPPPVVFGAALPRPVNEFARPPAGPGGAQAAGTAVGAPVLPSSIPAGTQLLVTIVDAINVSTVQSGNRFQGKLAAPVRLPNGQVLPAGEEVRIGARLVAHGAAQNLVRILLSAASVSVDGKPIPVTTNEAVKIVPKRSRRPRCSGGHHAAVCRHSRELKSVRSESNNPICRGRAGRSSNTLRPPSEGEMRCSCSTSRSEIGLRRAALLHHSHELVEPFEAVELLRVPYLRPVQRAAQNAQRFVVRFERHGKRMPVFAAQCEGVSCRIGEARGRTVHHFRHQRRASGASAAPGSPPAAATRNRAGPVRTPPPEPLPAASGPHPAGAPHGRAASPAGARPRASSRAARGPRRAAPAARATASAGSTSSGRTEKKAEVNASGRKIGGADLAPVTQLFTEDYMVRFLLENSLGAWWAARHPDSDLPREWDYLRFADDGTPAAGIVSRLAGARRRGDAARPLLRLRPFPRRRLRHAAPDANGRRKAGRRRRRPTPCCATTSSGWNSTPAARRSRPLPSPLAGLEGRRPPRGTHPGSRAPACRWRGVWRNGGGWRKATPGSLKRPRPVVRPLQRRADPRQPDRPAPRDARVGAVPARLDAGGRRAGPRAEAGRRR